MKLYRALWPSRGTPTGSPGAPLEPLASAMGQGTSRLKHELVTNRRRSSFIFLIFQSIAQEIPPYFSRVRLGFFTGGVILRAAQVIFSATPKAVAHTCQRPHNGDGMASAVIVTRSRAKTWHVYHIFVVVKNCVKNDVLLAFGTVLGGTPAKSQS